MLKMGTTDTTAGQGSTSLVIRGVPRVHRRTVMGLQASQSVGVGTVVGADVEMKVEVVMVAKDVVDIEDVAVRMDTVDVVGHGRRLKARPMVRSIKEVAVGIAAVAALTERYECSMRICATVAND